MTIMVLLMALTGCISPKTSDMVDRPAIPGEDGDLLMEGYDINVASVVASASSTFQGDVDFQGNMTGDGSGLTGVGTPTAAEIRAITATQLTGGTHRGITVAESGVFINFSNTGTFTAAEISQITSGTQTNITVASSGASGNISFAASAAGGTTTMAMADIVIAGTNSSAQWRAVADYECDSADCAGKFETAMAATGHGTFLVAPGSYSIISTIEVPVSNIDIVGMKGNHMYMNSGSDMWDINLMSDVLLDGLYLDGRDTKLFLSGSVVYNNRGVEGGATNFEMKNCKVIRFGGKGLFMGSDNTPNRHTVDGAYIHHNEFAWNTGSPGSAAGNGIYFEKWASDVWIDSNWIHHNDMMGAPMGAVSGLRFTNNLVEFNGSHGFNLEGLGYTQEGFLVEGNIFRSNGTNPQNPNKNGRSSNGIVIQYGARGGTVRDNYITKSGSLAGSGTTAGHGIVIRGRYRWNPGTLAYVSDIKILNNDIVGNPLDGISVYSGAFNVLIDGNNVWENNTKGVAQDNSYNKNAGIAVWAHQLAWAPYRPTNITITNNFCYNSSGSQNYTWSAGQVREKDQIISGIGAQTQVYGIWVANVDGLILKNNITYGNTTQDIYLDRSNKKVVIDGNFTSDGSGYTGVPLHRYNPLKVTGTWGGTVRSGTAGASIDYGDLCYLSGDGTWKVADFRAAATTGGSITAVGQLAVACEGLVNAGTGTFLVDGWIRNNSWSYTKGDRLYGSKVAGGGMVPASSGNFPDTAGQFVRCIGYADTNAYTIRFCPSLEAIVLQ